MTRYALRSLLGWTRERRVTELLAMLWIVSLCDLILTLWANAYTPFHEVNPLARTLLNLGAYTTLIAFKISCTIVGTLVLFKIRKTTHGEITVWLMTFVYLGLAMKWYAYTASVLH